MYNVTWRRVNDTTLEFTCELACRTPVIFGCNVNLINSDSHKILSSFSTILSGTNDAISSHIVIILVNGIDPAAEYIYIATPQARTNETTISFNGIEGLILPAEVTGMHIRIYNSGISS